MIKSTCSTLAICAGVVLVSASPVLAQSQGGALATPRESATPAHPGAATAPRGPVVYLPPRVVVLPVEQVGSTEPGPQSPEAARKEAAAAMAEARQRCRLEPDRQSRADCLSDARDDRDQLLQDARDGRSS